MALILTKSKNHIHEISLNHPETLNAMGQDLLKELTNSLENGIRSDDKIIIIKGQGSAFCSGGNIKDFNKMLSEQKQTTDILDNLHASIKMINTSNKIVIALVHGFCAGAGLSLVLACDLAIAAKNAKFKLSYSQLGLSPDGGCTHSLAKLIGHKKAMELIISDEVISAEKAQTMGFINKIVDLEELNKSGDLLAKNILKRSSKAMSYTKKLLQKSFSNTLDKQLKEEAECITSAMSSNYFKKAVTEFLSSSTKVV